MMVDLQMLEALALNFEVYANDQRASIAHRWVRGRGIKDAEIRAEVWEEAAKDIRDAIRLLDPLSREEAP
ncbi:MAG: hypothetical protein RLZZ129_643 [Verrucomicrobiota bacterium]|jgi:hypothetical protein